MTPPEPIRMSSVAAPMAASSTSGELPARQWALWCSDTQKRR